MKAIVKAGLLGSVLVAMLGVMAQAAHGSERKIDLAILFAGNSSSPRAADFVTFLGTHFARVESVDLRNLSEEQTGHFDVVLLDHDAQRPPRPEFSEDYAVPTVTIGVAGAHIASTNRLKTGYS